LCASTASERNVFQSLSAAKLDKYGDIDKSGDNKPSGAKSHETDTARYFLWEIYGRMYPGNRNSVLDRIMPSLRDLIFKTAAERRQAKAVPSRLYEAMIWGKGWEDYTRWDKTKAYRARL
jgi:hypothetical protein